MPPKFDPSEIKEGKIIIIIVTPERKKKNTCEHFFLHSLIF
jgi:hypothetical protein